MNFDKPNAYRVREPVQIAFAEQGRTKQSFRDECDINNIMAKFIKTGVTTHINTHGGQYFDCEAIDFREALEVIQNAEDMFMDLPAVVRRSFSNDPAEFLEFVQNPANADKLAEMGLTGAPPKDAAPIPKIEAAPQEKQKNSPDTAE